MKREVINYDKLRDNEFINSLGLKFAIEYYYDKVVVSEFLKELALEDIIEARYFTVDKELRILNVNGCIKGILVSDEPEDDMIQTKHLVIDNKFNNIRFVKLKKYIDYDNDGQAYIQHIRPFELS